VAGIPGTSTSISPAPPDSLTSPIPTGIAHQSAVFYLFDRKQMALGRAVMAARVGHKCTADKPGADAGKFLTVLGQEFLSLGVGNFFVQTKPGTQKRVQMGNHVGDIIDGPAAGFAADIKEDFAICNFPPTSQTIMIILKIPEKF
jgi:hypothetical protein